MLQQHPSVTIAIFGAKIAIFARRDGQKASVRRPRAQLGEDRPDCLGEEVLTHACGVDGQSGGIECRA
jgi:hypothetical protein